MEYREMPTQDLQSRVYKLGGLCELRVRLPSARL